METQQTVVVPSSVSKAKHAVPAKVMLLAKLAERFMPYVDAILRPKAKTGIASLMDLITQRAPEIRDLMVSLKDGTAPAGRTRAFAACGIGLRPRTLGKLKKKVEASVSDAVESATFTLVLAWLDTFPKVKQAMLTIDADSLDSAMLPRLDAELSRRFADRCERIAMSVTDATNILRAVRAALPAGDVIPDEAAQLLGASIITVVR